MCGSVLGFEAIVLALSTPVMITIAGIPPRVAVSVGVGLAVIAVVVAASLRFRPAYVAGWLLQLAAIGLGFVVPAMFIMGVVFGALWATAYVLGRRVEQLKAERESTGH